MFPIDDSFGSHSLFKLSLLAVGWSLYGFCGWKNECLSNLLGGKGRAVVVREFEISPLSLPRSNCCCYRRRHASKVFASLRGPHGWLMYSTICALFDWLWLKDIECATFRDEHMTMTGRGNRRFPTSRDETMSGRLVPCKYVCGTIQKSVLPNSLSDGVNNLASMSNQSRHSFCKER